MGTHGPWAIGHVHGKPDLAVFESELDTVQAHYLQLQAEKALLGATKDQELEVQVAKAAKELGALQEEYALLQAAKASMAAAKDEEAPSMPT